MPGGSGRGAVEGVALSLGKLCHPTAVLSVNRKKKNWCFCLQCGEKGKPVSLAIVGAMAKTELEAAKLSAQEYYLCRNCDCPVVYHAGEVQLEKSDLRVPVNFKEKNYQGPVCYCFNHTVASIRAERQSSGRSSAAEMGYQGNSGRSMCLRG